MKAIENINLAIRFLLEIGALLALGYWGFRTGSEVTRWILGIGAPLLAVVTWALFVSEKPAVELSRPVQLGIEFVVMGTAAWALATTSSRSLALVLAIGAAISGILNFIWD